MGADLGPGAAEYDVVVVGAGPAGVVTGMLLGDRGVRTLVVDRHTGISELPRARGIHARATEILRQLRVEDDLVAAALPVVPRLELRPSLAQPPAFDATTGGDTWAEVSPCEGVAIAQDVLEGVLRRHLGTRESVTLQLGRRLTGLDLADPAAVRATIADVATGAEHEVTARYVVGADGWRSDVRGLCGIEVTGPADLGRRRSVRFRADLSPWLGSPPPAMVILSGVDAVVLATHPDHRWVLLSEVSTGAVVSPEERVRAALGIDVAIEVLGDSEWVAAVQLADRFAAGRVFLAGDAAHRVTPAGATGISSALADAHNLVWKLAAVLEGWGGPGLLPSYDQERREVARVCCAENLRIWQDFVARRPPSADLRMLDMGYRYGSAIVVDDEPGRHPVASDAGTAPSAYRQEASPGARAPHAWLDRDGRRVSTLDLFGDGFTLLTGPAGSAWGAAASEAAAALRVPLVVEVLSEASVVEAFELGDAGAVLVRPDGHVAWRTRAAPPTREDAATQLGRVLTIAVGG